MHINSLNCVLTRSLARARITNFRWIRMNHSMRHTNGLAVAKRASEKIPENHKLTSKCDRIAFADDGDA